MSGFGFAEIIARIEAVTPLAIEAALKHGAEASAAQTPKDTGDLVGSQEIEVHGDEGSVSYDTPYAHRQHEDLSYHHPNGGNAKYLEIPWLSEHDAMIEICGAIITEAL